MVREIERFCHRFDRGLGIDEAGAAKRIRHDGLAMTRVHEIADILGDGRQARMVFPAPFCDTEQNAAASSCCIITQASSTTTTRFFISVRISFQMN